MSQQSSTSSALALVYVAYIVALAVAIATGFLLRTQHPLVVAAAADIAGTIVIFGFSVAFNNSSFYDPYWSVAPILLGAYWALSPFGGDELRQFVLLTLTAIWGGRLTFNWARGWKGLKNEDWRYVDLRASSGKAYWLVSFAGIQMFPTAIVFLGCLAMFYAITGSNRPLGPLDAVATILTAAAIWLEAAADQQLHRFVQQNKTPGASLRTGLWAYSRHPNYLGEITFWWGLFLFAIAADTRFWWTIIGPIAMTVLFVFISIPMIEKRHLKRRHDYPEIIRQIPMLLPAPRRTFNN